MHSKSSILALLALATLTLASPVLRQAPSEDEGGAAIFPGSADASDPVATSLPDVPVPTDAPDVPAATSAPDAPEEIPATTTAPGEEEEPAASTEPPAAPQAPGSGACLARDANCGLGFGDCCGGSTCTEAPWMGAGVSMCLETPPSCYNEGMRNTGAEGEEYVPYAPCCPGLVEKEVAEMGYGKFCVREGGEAGAGEGAAAPVTIAAETTVMAGGEEEEAPAAVTTAAAPVEETTAVVAETEAAEEGAAAETMATVPSMEGDEVTMAPETTEAAAGGDAAEGVIAGGV